MTIIVDRGRQTTAQQQQHICRPDQMPSADLFKEKKYTCTEIRLTFIEETQKQTFTNWSDPFIHFIYHTVAIPVLSIVTSQIIYNYLSYIFACLFAKLFKDKRNVIFLNRYALGGIFGTSCHLTRDHLTRDTRNKQVRSRCGNGCTSCRARDKSKQIMICSTADCV